VQRDIPMRTIESSSRTALVRLLPYLLLGGLGGACNGRLAISDETLTDAGVGGNGGTGSVTPPESHPDAGTPTDSCEDGLRSGGESDIDCGGEACPACPSGASCERHTDCQGGTCLAGACVASSCEDGIRNGDEAGVDCGGGCQRCRSTTCNCASSPGLTPLGCDETEGYLTQCGQNFLSADGQTFVFAMCYMESANAGVTSGYELFRRRSDGTTEALGDAGALGLSADGQQLLVYEGSELGIVNAAGVRTALPIPQVVASDARISGDGATVFGGVATDTGARTLARWTESGGLETLGEFPLLAEAAHWELAVVNHDGTVVAGYVDDGTRLTPFRWTAAGGVEALGTLPDGATGAQPTAISADGSTIAGYTLTSGADRSIFRWTAQDQLEVMGGAPPVGYLSDAALFLSADGTVLAGTALNGAARVIVWGPGGTQGANADLGIVTDMTPDGSTLVGITSGPAGFLWHPPGVGPNPPGSSYDVSGLETLVAQSGADSTGWALQTITSVSDDARVIYGTGTCGGVPTYYRMQLSP
jgi:hypothetical protein